MHNVLFVPKLACSLFSVRAAAAKGNSIKFGNSKCWIRNSSGALCRTGLLVDKMYQLHCTPMKTSEHVHTSTTMEPNKKIDLWHRRLEHLNEQQLKNIIQKELVTGAKFPRSEDLSFCEGCIEGKMHRGAFKPVGEIRTTKRLQLVQ